MLNPDVWTVVVLAVGVWALYWWGQRTDDALRNQLYVQQRLLVSRGYERMADGRYRRPGAPPVYVKYEVQEVRPKVQGVITTLSMEGPRGVRVLSVPSDESEDYRTGEDRFDEAFRVEGLPRSLGAMLRTEVRDQLRKMASFTRRLDLKGGDFSVEVDGCLAGAELEQWIAQLTAVAARLEVGDVEQRIAEVATHDPVPAVRRRALLQIRDPQVLGWGLRDPDGSVRAVAAFLRQDWRALEVVSDADLAEAAWEIRWEQVGSESVLLRMLSMELPLEIGAAVVEALGKVGTFTAVPVLQRQAKRWFGRKLQYHSERAVAAIEARLGSGGGRLALAENPRLEGALSESEEGRLSVSANTDSQVD